MGLLLYKNLCLNNVDLALFNPYLVYFEYSYSKLFRTISQSATSSIKEIVTIQVSLLKLLDNKTEDFQTADLFMVYHNY